MRIKSGLKVTAVVLLAGLVGVARPALAERLLRTTETTMGDADPDKPVDIPGSVLMLNLYDFLVRVEAGGKIVPAAAKSWTISPDGLVYTFTLRDDVKFHDGTLLTAKDVAFSARRIVTIKRGYAFIFSMLKTVEAIDPTTVRFTLSQPFAPFLAGLVRLAILNEDLVLKNKRPGDYGEFGDYGQAFLSGTDAGSGPYRLIHQSPQDESVLQRVGGYYLGEAPDAPDTVRIRFGNEAPIVRAQLARHEMEVTRTALAPEILTALVKMPGIKLGVDRVPQMFQMKLNMQKAPTDDPAFRKAIVLGFDYDALYALLDVGGIKSGTPTHGSIPVGAMGYDPGLPIMKRDLAGAKAALAQSKYKPDQYPLEMIWTKEVPQFEKYALLFQQNMADLGIKVTITSPSWAQIQQMATSPQSTPNVSTINVGITTPDIDSLLWPEYHSSSPGTYNSMGWAKSAEIDDLLEQGRKLTDPEAREAIYRKLNRSITELHPAIFGYDYGTVEAMQDYVHAPTLENPAQSIPMQGGNFQFRMMSVTK